MGVSLFSGKERPKRLPSALPKKGGERGEKKRPATARVGLKSDVLHHRDPEQVLGKRRSQPVCTFEVSSFFFIFLVSQFSQIPKMTIAFSVEKTNEDDQGSVALLLLLLFLLLLLLLSLLCLCVQTGWCYLVTLKTLRHRH